MMTNSTTAHSTSATRSPNAAFNPSAPADQALQTIANARVLPVLRTSDAAQASDLITEIARSGLIVVELTATTPNWSDLLQSTRQDFPDLLIGIGTVSTATDALQALKAGAQFLVSPYPAPEVAAVAEAHNVLFIEGGFTPAEIASATKRGIGKLFPAHVGGSKYLRSLQGILPGAKIIPTGGIAIDDVPEWLAAGAFAVGIGSELSSGAGLQANLKQLATFGDSS